VEAAKEQRCPNGLPPVPQARDDNNKVKKLHGDNGDTQIVMDNEFEVQAEQDQDNEHQRVGPVK
jgi:hypothetical protein